jgi:hypothetical protein
LTLRIVPITQREAFAFLKRHHRHHDPPRGTVFQIAAANDSSIVGVAIVERPKARLLQDDWTVEVSRLCVAPGLAHCAASKLLRQAWQVASRLGYRRLVTYTLPEEGGSSLRGAGFTLIGEAGGGSWSREKRPRVDSHPTQAKLRWEVAA